MKLLKRIARINYDIPKRKINRQILPTGYDIYRSMLSPQQIQFLRSVYNPKSSDFILDSGKHEKRWGFYDTQTLMDMLYPGYLPAIMESFKSSEPDPAFIMRNLILSTGPVGSGGGWHRDSFSPALKIFVPLSVADKTNGAMQYCPSSLKYKMLMKSALGGLRVTDVDLPWETLELAPGDVVVADVSAIHRGGPVTTPGRDMLTVYFKNAR